MEICTCYNFGWIEIAIFIVVLMILYYYRAWVKWHFKNRIQVNGTNEKVGNTADTGDHEKTQFIHLGRNSNFRWDYYYFIPVTFRYTTAGTGDVRFDWYMNKGSTGSMGNIRGGGIQYTVYEVVK